MGYGKKLRIGFVKFSKLRFMFISGKPDWGEYNTGR